MSEIQMYLFHLFYLQKYSLYYLIYKKWPPQTVFKIKCGPWAQKFVHPCEVLFSWADQINSCGYLISSSLLSSWNDGVMCVVSVKNVAHSEIKSSVRICLSWKCQKEVWALLYISIRMRVNRHTWNCSHPFNQLLDTLWKIKNRPKFISGVFRVCHWL